MVTPMLDAMGKPNEAIFIEDKLHMNADGYTLWAKKVQRFWANRWTCVRETYARNRLRTTDFIAAKTAQLPVCSPLP